MRLPRLPRTTDPPIPEESPEARRARKGVVYGSLVFAAVLGVLFVVFAIYGLISRWRPALVFAGVCLIGFIFTIRLAFWDRLKMWLEGVGGAEARGPGVLRPGPAEQQATPASENDQPLPPKRRLARLRSLKDRLPRNRKSGSG